MKPTPLKIGNISLPNCVVLAPMAGVTDLPFRQMAYRLGAGMVVSEMLTSDKRLWNSRKSRLRLKFGDDTGPKVVQIAGGDAEMLSDAAREVADLGAEMIDINMGCPAKKVCNKAAGSALLRDEKLVADILQSVVGSVDVPVTLKIRTGWSLENKNAVTVAKIAEDSGIACVTVHGRTRACRFVGDVDYDSIAAVKASVSIPVIANGDIDSAVKAEQIMLKTGVDGVMVGRAALGQPWILGNIAQYLHKGLQLRRPNVQDVRNLLLEHLATLHAFYDEFLGTRIARKHVAWYLQYIPQSEEFRKQFNKIDSADAQVFHLAAYFEQYLMTYKEEG
ncbi:MAG: tRNA dihydrouridine synthase DusB [Pseudomonadales bacterium]